jgi:hypothetical protein
MGKLLQREAYLVEFLINKQLIDGLRILLGEGRIHSLGNILLLIQQVSGTITLQKKGWNPNKLLTRADFEPIGTVKHDGSAASNNLSHKINVQLIAVDIMSY